MNNRSPWNTKPVSLRPGQKPLPFWGLPPPTTVTDVSKPVQKRIPLSSNEPLNPINVQPKVKLEPNTDSKNVQPHNSPRMQPGLLPASPLAIKPNMPRQPNQIRPQFASVFPPRSQIQIPQQPMQQPGHNLPHNITNPAITQLMQIPNPIMPIPFVENEPKMHTEPVQATPMSRKAEQQYFQPTNNALWRVSPNIAPPPIRRTPTPPDKKMRKSKSSLSLSILTQKPDAFKTLTPSQSILSGEPKSPPPPKPIPPHFPKSESVVADLTKFMESRIRPDEIVLKTEEEIVPSPPPADEKARLPKFQNVRDQLLQISDTPLVVPTTEKREDYVPEFFRQKASTYNVMDEPQCTNEFERSLFETKKKKKGRSKKTAKAKTEPPVEKTHTPAAEDEKPATKPRQTSHSHSKPHPNQTRVVTPTMPDANLLALGEQILAQLDQADAQMDPSLKQFLSKDITNADSMCEFLESGDDQPTSLEHIRESPPQPTPNVQNLDQEPPATFAPIEQPPHDKESINSEPVLDAPPNLHETIPVEQTLEEEPPSAAEMATIEPPPPDSEPTEVPIEEPAQPHVDEPSSGHEIQPKDNESPPEPTQPDQEPFITEEDMAHFSELRESRLVRGQPMTKHQLRTAKFTFKLLHRLRIEFV